MKPLVLARNSKSDYRIIVSKSCSSSEDHGANELRHYLSLVSGARFDVANDEVQQADKEILIGKSKHLDHLNLDIDYSRLGQEGFIVKTYRDYLVIAGGRLRGTMYGVYTFLQKYVGCKWLSSQVSRIPRLNEIILGQIDDIEVPHLEYRDVHYTDAFDADWSARNKVNGAFSKLDRARGGKVSYFPFVHSFDKLIPSELYEKHPEYFPLIEGKRLSGYVQRCLSNPEVVAFAKQRVAGWIQEHPEAKIISVSQNDTGNWCKCPDCSSLDDSEGSPSASVLSFVNQIAEEIERHHPDKIMDTLAYQYSRKPPRTIRPRHNVIVRLCTIECCFAHPLDSCDSEQNKKFTQDIEAWSRIAPKLYIWDYVTNFANYVMPFPNLRVLGPNIKFFMEHNVKGIFEEGNYSAGGKGELAELRAYILAKLLWNPDSDVDITLNEFLDGYYQNASKPIKEYMDLLHDQVERHNLHVSIYSPSTSEYLSEDIVSKADQLLAEGERMAEGSESRMRARLAHLPIQYVMIERLYVKGERRRALLTDFLNTIEKAGITNISEGMTVEQYKIRLEHQEKT